MTKRDIFVDNYRLHSSNYWEETVKDTERIYHQPCQRILGGSVNIN